MVAWVGAVAWVVVVVCVVVVWVVVVWVLAVLRLSIDSKSQAMRLVSVAPRVLVGGCVWERLWAQV